MKSQKREKRKCFHKNRNGVRNEGVLIHMFYLHDQRKNQKFCIVLYFAFNVVERVAWRGGGLNEEVSSI